LSTAAFEGPVKPLFHASGRRSWAISTRALAFIANHIPPGSRTLETGAGLSTSFFAAQGYEHTAITVSADEPERIKAYCRDHAIDDSRVRYVVQPSDVALPVLQTEPLDFFLIDGGHGFPMPQIDWYYGAKLLKLGGIVGIDDVELYSVRLLTDFLRHEDAWEHLATIGAKTSFYRLVKPFKYKEWDDQSYIRRKSLISIRVSQAKRLASYIRHGEWTRIRNALNSRHS